MTIGEGLRRGYNECRVMRVYIVWVMRVYIVWVKGREVTLKKAQGRMFRDCLAGRPYSRDTRESDSLARLLCRKYAYTQQKVKRIYFIHNL